MNLTDRKVIVLGLDGATWDLLRPWAEAGKLPYLGEIMGKGVWGKLESTIPSLTAPAWVSFATGKNPGKHGCYDFLIPRGSLSNWKPITTADIKGETFYEILDRNRKKCILINLPCSYPPRIKEPTITSILTQGSAFIFPPDLINEVPELENYRIIADKSLQFGGQDLEYIEDIAKLENNRFECARKLFTNRNWDFFFLLFSGTDWAQHVMYDKLISGNMKENSKPMKLYQQIDEYVGWFVANAPRNANIIIMSDHGFEVRTKAFYINEWLKEEGYLITEPRTRMPVAGGRGRREVNRLLSQKRAIRLPRFFLRNLTSIFYLMILYKKLRKILPFRLEMDVAQPRISQTSALNAYPRTDVGGIYINDMDRFTDGKVAAKDYERLRDELVEKLGALVNPKSGERVVDKIWKKEEVYSGAQLHLAPDIVFISNKYVVDSTLSGKIFLNRITNSHYLNGIFAACGVDIKRGHHIEEAIIYDLAPTILHMFGLPIPDDMDGKVLTEIFREDSEPRRREITYQQVDYEAERIKNRIMKLKKSSKL